MNFAFKQLIQGNYDRALINIYNESDDYGVVNDTGTDDDGVRLESIYT